MKKAVVFAASCFVLAVVLASCASSPSGGTEISGSTSSSVPPQESGEISSAGSYREIWAYLMDGEEEYLDTSFPVSDIGYFGAGLNTFGELTGVPDRLKIAGYSGRVHLVVADNSRALTHFCLDPGYSVRDNLLKEIAEASADFDGVQIDFELVSERDREHFFSFLAELKALVYPKPLSVAIPARTRDIAGDPYDYSSIVPHVDRILVMAYDEHWSGGPAGPVASMDWCASVSEYARSKIPSGKLIMGLPFYARAWGSPDPSRAYKFSTLSELADEKQINLSSADRTGGHPNFSYKETVTVSVYFDDADSVFRRAEMYRSSGIDKIGFWRLGQEAPGVWEKFRLE